MNVSGRAGYLATSLAVFASQHVAVLAVLSTTRTGLGSLPWWFWINPFRALVGSTLASQGAGSLVLTVGMVATLAVDVALVFLAFQRVRRVDGGGWAAALTIVPVVQLGAIAWLAFARQPRSPVEPTVARAPATLAARTSVAGVLLGVGAIVATVALSTLVLGLYGYALFLISPFLIAVAVGYLANRGSAVGLRRTVTLVAFAFLLSAAALMGFAFEGLICLLLASPIIGVVGLVGAILGAALAEMGVRSRGTTLTSVAFVPLLIVAEAVFPPRATFTDVQAVDIAAPRSAVWDAVVHMQPITAAPVAPFSWGLAYPLRGMIEGEGVGAVRRSLFSTGEAYERVITWAPGAELAFAVLSEPPAMRELSPYVHVNAPHAAGYFRTEEVRFRLEQMSGGRTRLSLASRHDLDLEPALYWTPMARWAVRANKLRVLAHIRDQAERPSPQP